MNEQKKSRDFDRMLVEAVLGKYSFFAWQSIGGVVEKCEFKIKAYRKDYNEIELEIGTNQEEKLAKVISGDRVLNIYAPEISVSFSSEIKVITADKKIKIYLPKEYSFYDRRKQERVEPTKTCYVNFEYNKQMYRKSIFDISLGGIAIILPKSDKILITKGKQFEVFTLDIGLKKIKVKAECTNSFNVDPYKFENLPYGGYKVAFRFTDISKDDKAFLSEFIAHQKLTQQVTKKAN